MAQTLLGLLKKNVKQAGATAGENIRERAALPFAFWLQTNWEAHVEVGCAVEHYLEEAPVGFLFSRFLF